MALYGHHTFNPWLVDIIPNTCVPAYWSILCRHYSSLIFQWGWNNVVRTRRLVSEKPALHISTRWSPQRTDPYHNALLWTPIASIQMVCLIIYMTSKKCNIIVYDTAGLLTEQSRPVICSCSASAYNAWQTEMKLLCPCNGRMEVLEPICLQCTIFTHHW